MSKNLIYIIVGMKLICVSFGADEVFKPHQDLSPKKWDNLFEEMNQKQEEEEYQQQEARFDSEEAQTREILSIVRQFSQRATNLAELGTEELQTLRFKSYNSLMLEEHRRIEYALNILADQLDIELLPYSSADPALAQLRKINEMKFEQQYRDAVLNLHAEMLAYLRRPEIKDLEWSVVRETLSDIEYKTSNLLELIRQQ